MLCSCRRNTTTLSVSLFLLLSLSSYTAELLVPVLPARLPARVHQTHHYFCPCCAPRYIPTPRNAMDRALPAFAGGRSPSEACTCNNGNGSPAAGCDRGLRGNADGQSCLWWSQGCSIGCDTCKTATAGTAPISGNPPQAGKIGFGKSYCANPKTNATLPRHAWTLNMDAIEGSEEDRYRFNPWRAPGWAPVVDACGQAGGEYGYQKLGGVRGQREQERKNETERGGGRGRRRY